MTGTEAAKKLHLQIITPHALKLSEQADMVIMRCKTGDMGIMPGHLPISTALGDGVLRILNGGTERRLAVLGGLAVLRDNTLTILTAHAELPHEIDYRQAEADRQNALARLQQASDTLHIQKDQVLLRRALVLIEVSSDLFIGKDD